MRYLKIRTGFISMLFILFAIVSARAHQNIILISVDTLRADHLSCYGYPIPTSPAIDSLASDSLLFRTCFTLTPLTTPAMSTILTALPPYKHGAKRNGLSIYNRIKTLPYHLKNKGYYSAAFISNWPLRKKLSRLHRHFDGYHEVFTKKRWLGIMQPEGKAETVTERAIKWLTKHRTDRFFLWIHYTEPHAPYIKQKGFLHSGYKPDSNIYPTGTRLKKVVKYDSEISYTDFYIGKVLDTLRQYKLYTSALIVFVSDHGESFGEHNYFKHGRRLYNSTLHVPLIIKRPNEPDPGAVIKSPVCLLDIMPTILTYLDIDRPKEIEGIDLFSEDERSLERTIFFETYRGAVHFKKSQVGQIKIRPTYFGVLKYPHKLIGKINFKNLRFKSIEAYQLEQDFFELRNTWFKKSEPLMKLSKLLKKQIFKTKQYIKYSKKYYKQNSKISKEDMDKLKTLGYI